VNVNGRQYVEMSRETAHAKLEALSASIAGAPSETKRIGFAIGKAIPGRFATVDAIADMLVDLEPRVNRKKAVAAIKAGREESYTVLVDPDALSKRYEREEYTQKRRMQKDVERELREEEAGDRPPLVDAVLNWADLVAQPEPRWAVDGVIPERATVLVYGASGVGKSFLVDSIAAAVAGGFPWLGRSVEGGGVLVIAAEGGAGVGKRFRAQSDAWNKGKPIDGLRVMTAAPNLTLDSDVAELEAFNRVHDFAVIVYDTLNRIAGDAEENSATAMGGILNAIERIRRAGTRTTSVVVTHAGKSGDLRGSTALWAAADTVLELTGEPGYLKLDARKQKDAPDGVIGFYRLKVASAHDTLILEGVAPGQAEPSGVLDARREEALAHFVRAFGTTGGTRAQLVDLLVDAGTAKKSTAQTYVGDLVAAGSLVARPHGARGTWLELAPERATFAINPDTEK